MSDDITASIYPVERYGISLSNVPRTEAQGLVQGLKKLRTQAYGPSPSDGSYTTGTRLLDALIKVLVEVDAA